MDNNNQNRNGGKRPSGQNIGVLALILVITLIAVTATSEDGSNTVTKYVAVKAETYYTVTVTNNDTDCAVKVSGKVIAAGGSHAVVAEKLTAGSNLELTIELETGKTIGAITATGATAVVFNNVVSLTNVTGDVAVTIANG